MTSIVPLVKEPRKPAEMFASTQSQQSSTDTSTTTSDESSGTYFDERSEIHEIYWVAVDANRRNGPTILQHPDLHTKKTGEGVSGIVDDYRFFNEQKTDLIEEITGDLDMYGLRKYREDFAEPDEEAWVEAASEFYGIPIVGVHMVPEDEASDRFGVDYSKDSIDPIYVPILEVDGEEVVYDPMEYYDEADAPEQEEAEADSDDSDESETKTPAVPSFPAKPTEVQQWLEERPADSLNLQEQSALAKLRDPSKSNRDIAADIDCSKNTVRKGLMKFLGKDGYEAVKARGKELSNADDGDDETDAAADYAAKMAATSGSSTTDDGDDESADTGKLAELEARVERLESMFNVDALDN